VISVDTVRDTVTIVLGSAPELDTETKSVKGEDKERPHYAPPEYLL
jgi:hypothetical protein